MANYVTQSSSVDFSDDNLTNVNKVSLKEITSDDATSVSVTLGDDAGDDFKVDSTSLVVEGDTGNVGIGTATPGRTVDILNASDPQLRVSQADDTIYADVQVKGTAGGVHITPTGGTYAGHTFLKSGSSSSYLVVQNSTTGNTDDRTKGLTVGVGSNIAYLWMRSSNGSLGQLKIGVDGANAITIDASNNTTAVNNLSTNGNVTLGDAGTDEHTLNGALKLSDQSSLNISTPSVGADLKATGVTATMVSGAAIAAFELVCCSTVAGQIIKTDASAIGTMPVIGIATEAFTGADEQGAVLLEGFARNDAWTWTPGAILYASETPGEITATAPTAGFVQAIGVALTADIIKFSPSLTLVEVAS